MKDIMELIKVRRLQQQRAISMLKFGDLVLAVESQNQVHLLDIDLAKFRQEEFAKNVLASSRHLGGLHVMATNKVKRPAAKPMVENDKEMSVNPTGVYCAS